MLCTIAIPFYELSSNTIGSSFRCGDYLLIISYTGIAGLHMTTKVPTSVTPTQRS